MIKKCYKNTMASESLALINGSVYIKNTILMYLNAYGTKFDFCEVFIQLDSEEVVTSVILRYNSFIYCSFDKKADCDELILWLKGYSDVTVYCDLLPLELLQNIAYERCFEMCRKGKISEMGCVHFLTDSKSLQNTAVLINSGSSKNTTDEYFLDLCHLVRHKLLKVFCIESENTLVSVTGVADVSSEESIITFVFTNKHFRGNGYSGKVLNAACNKTTSTYRLICSEENLLFYDKCGFVKSNNCLKIYF